MFAQLMQQREETPRSKNGEGSHKRIENLSIPYSSQSEEVCSSHHSDDYYQPPPRHNHHKLRNPNYSKEPKVTFLPSTKKIMLKNIYIGK